MKELSIGKCFDRKVIRKCGNFIGILKWKVISILVRRVWMVNRKN